MSEMNLQRPSDGVQIMLGVYKLFQSEEVGKLYVEELAGPTRTREHWILYSSYPVSYTHLTLPTNREV